MGNVKRNVTVKYPTKIKKIKHLTLETLLLNTLYRNIAMLK